MRRLFFLVSVLIFLGIASVTPPSSLSVQSLAVRIMPLGDSLTEGYPEMQGGYRPQFWTRLMLDGFQTELVGSMTDGFAWAQPHHEGHSGWTIADIDGQIAGWMTASQPDIVLLMIGTNDILSDQFSGSTARLNTLIDHIFAAKSDVRLVVAQLLPINEITYNAQVAQFNAALTDLITAQALEGRRITLGEFNAAFTTADLIDGVHLTPDAYNRLGDQWYNVTAKLLRDPFQQLTPIVNQVIHTPLYPFSWTQGTADETYQIKLRSLDGVYRFKAKNIPASVCVDGICRITLDFSGGTPPPSKTVMKWKVVGNNRKTGWQVYRNDFPGKPVLLQPVSGAQLTTLTPDFVWSRLADATTYTLLLDQINLPTPEGYARLVTFTFDDTSTPSVSNICQVDTGVCTVNLAALSTALPGTGDYRWRIKAASPYGVSRSHIFLFSVTASAAQTSPQAGAAILPLPAAPNASPESHLQPRN